MRNDFFLREYEDRSMSPTFDKWDLAPILFTLFHMKSAETAISKISKCDMGKHTV